MDLNNSLNFAAFIITYKRPEILKNTITNLLSQQYPPSEILIVDNSPDRLTEELIAKLDNPKITYFRVGHNSGPAGGSKLGLKILANKGYKWIYWGDDNNPPRDESVFRRMFECLSILENGKNKIGALSGKGGKLNDFTGRIRSLSNAYLKKGEILEVDMFPGGHTVIVNSEIVEHNILPDENLFFAFEDLDVSLKLRKAGYKIFIDAKTWYEVRKAYGDTSDNYRPRKINFGNRMIYWNREFYSTRNLLHIFYYQQMVLPFLYQLIKTLFKMPYGFRFGIKYGWRNLKIQLSAIADFLKGNYQNNLKVD